MGFATMLLGFAATATSVPAQEANTVRVPPVVIVETKKRYLLTGDDRDELRRQLRPDLLPAESGGSNGQTRGQIGISYEFEMRAASCRLMAAQVTLHITTTLPEWQPKTKVPQTLMESWNRSFAALEQHEAQHAQQARVAAEEVREGLLNLGEQPRCKDIERTAQRNLERAMMRLEFQGRRLDMRTDFGRMGSVAF